MPNTATKIRAKRMGRALRSSATHYMPYIVVAGAALSCIVAAPFFLRKGPKTHIQADKEVRENLSEHDIDKTLKDSFPASDPPGGY